MIELKLSEWIQVLDLETVFYDLIHGYSTPAAAKIIIRQRRYTYYPNISEDYTKALDRLELWTEQIADAIAAQEPYLEKLKREAWRMRNVDPDFPARFQWDRTKLVGQYNGLEGIEMVLRALRG